MEDYNTPYSIVDRLVARTELSLSDRGKDTPIESTLTIAEFLARLRTFFHMLRDDASNVLIISIVGASAWDRQETHPRRVGETRGPPRCEKKRKHSAVLVLFCFFYFCSMVLFRQLCCRYCYYVVGKPFMRVHGHDDTHTLF